MMEKKKRFAVEGMSCASCANHVEKAAKKVKGVKDASVNLLTNSVEITCEEKTPIEEIQKSIAKAGYKLILNAKKEEKVRKTPSNGNETKRFVLRLIPSFLFLVPLFYLGMGSMLSWPLGALETNVLNLALAELLLSLAILVINLPMFVSGFKSLLHLSPNMDSLVTLGSGISLIYSVVLLFLINSDIMNGSLEMASHHAMGLSFESAGMVPCFVLFGKTLESISKGKTTSAIADLLGLAPSEATVLRDDEERIVPIGDIRLTDTLLVRPGERIAIDGIVESGTSSNDESALTGESLPKDKKEGDTVYSGALNIDGFLKVKPTKVGNDTTISQIVSLVEETSQSKPKIARIADRISSFFIPCVLVISLLVFLGWLIFGGPFVSSLEHGRNSLSYAFERAVSVLVISCPCALGLATPVAVMVATGKGAKNGILFQNAEALEETSKCKYVVFDKTGTLTKGQMKVDDVLPEGITKEELLTIALSLESQSEHPLGKAITRYAKEKGIAPREVTAFKNVPGKGVSAMVNGLLCKAGNRSYTQECASLPSNAIAVAEALSKEGKTPLFFQKDGAFVGIITLSDELKEDAFETIQKLKKDGYKTVMLTGDSENVAHCVSNALDLDAYYASLLPKDKLEIVKKLKKEGKVLMVGDGINDAPSLLEANVGVAIGNGTDIAIESADIVLLGAGLKGLTNAMSLSRKSVHIILENLFWAFFYNLLMIPIAAGAFSAVGISSLKPWMGAMAMSLSSVSVVLNALRINLLKLDKGSKGNRRPKEETKMANYVIRIDGMMCEMCAKHVRDALQKEGLENVVVDLENKEASFDASSFEEAKIEKAIEKAGYSYKGRK